MFLVEDEELNREPRNGSGIEARSGVFLTKRGENRLGAGLNAKL